MKMMANLLLPPWIVWTCSETAPKCVSGSILSTVRLCLHGRRQKALASRASRDRTVNWLNNIFDMMG